MTGSPILAPGAVALVTGASAGIGVATVAALAARGCRVIATARRLDRLRALADGLGGAVLPWALDVRDAGATAGLIAALPEAWRNIDILVNNAGHDVGGRQRFDSGDVDEWADTIATNVVGLIRVTHAIAGGMVARGRGHIVNIGSVSGLESYLGGTIYAASKFAVHGFSGALRMDYAGSGVRVSEILPGLVRTEFALARWRGEKIRADAYYDQRGVTLAPEDIAASVVFALDQPPHVVIAQMVVMPDAPDG